MASSVDSAPMRQLGDPAPLAMGGFATTLLTLSLAMMDFRGVSNQTLFIANFCFVACVGLLISAQWELVRGNTFSYTAFSAFSLFYGGYGAVLLPSLGVVDAYGGKTPEYYNAIGFFLLIWAVLNFIFVVASFSTNIVSIIIFTTVELCFCLAAASNFALADGEPAAGERLSAAAGAFGFVARMMGLYATAHGLFKSFLPIVLPMGDISSTISRRQESEGPGEKYQSEV